VDIGLISWPRCSSAQQWSSPRAPPLLTPWPPLPFSGARSTAYLPLRPCSGLRAELLQLVPMAAPSSSPLRVCSPYVLISRVCPELCAPRNFLARLSLSRVRCSSLARRCPVRVLLAHPRGTSYMSAVRRRVPTRAPAPCVAFYSPKPEFVSRLCLPVCCCSSSDLAQVAAMVVRCLARADLRLLISPSSCCRW
jgi:hypothetical protein